MPRTTQTIYCARWRSYDGNAYAESDLSLYDLKTKVFGRPYAPSRVEVTFTTYSRKLEEI